MYNFEASSSSHLSNSSTTYSSARYMTTSIDHPKLINTDAAFIRSFLRAYDQYSKELTARANQLIPSDSTISTEAITPVNVSLWVDSDCPESLVSVGFIEGVTKKELKDSNSREYLEAEAEESKRSLTSKR